MAGAPDCLGGVGVGRDYRKLQGAESGLYALRYVGEAGLPPGRASRAGDKAVARVLRAARWLGIIQLFVALVGAVESSSSWTFRPTVRAVGFFFAGPPELSTGGRLKSVGVR